MTVDHASLCPYCGMRPLVTNNAYTSTTCGDSACQEAAFKTNTVWSSLGRQSKLALTERSPQMLDRVLGGYDRNVIDVVLAKCDKFASFVRRKVGQR